MCHVILREVAELVEMFLPFADVPVQTHGQRVEPVRDLVLGADRWHGVDGRCNAQAEGGAHDCRVAYMDGMIKCLNF